MDPGANMYLHRKNVKVVVLGDIGRSPRMQYHCVSLAEMDHKVDVIGYGETAPMPPIKKSHLIFYHYMFPVPQIPIKALNYAFKTLFQAINLLFLLFVTTKSHILLVQNPPAIPALIVCWIYTKIIGAKLIIDWHNYGHTIMALSASKNHPFVAITKKIEAIFGAQADSNFCVTNAMKNDLKDKWNISATTLYDRPPIVFRPLSLEEKHDFLVKFAKQYDRSLGGGKNDESNLITEIIDGNVVLKPSRPGILISSTSWTEDEDFSVLLSALQDYETHCQNGNVRCLPKLFCIITGKGPMKEYYLSRISQLNWRNIVILTPWLESEDYPLLLGSADLGVSLHTSSSGLDLPMKVVDMFGCGLPVSAHDFKCLDELVKHEENSFVFKSPQELSEQIFNWFDHFPNNNKQKQIETKFKHNLKEFQTLRWKDNWQQIAAPFFK